METTSSQSAQKYLLSCVNCRQRKIRCPRTYPCSHCVKQQVECRFPSRKKTQRKRLARQDELLGRLARLEEIVGKADGPQTDQAARVTAEDPNGSVGAAGVPAVSRDATTSRLVQLEQPRPGSQPGPDPSERYLSRDFWSNLCSEVEGLKQALEQPSESDEDEPEDVSSPGSYPGRPGDSGGTSIASNALLGTPGSTSTDHPFHPSPEHIRFLSSTYWTNVDPVIKILHRPTIQAAIESYLDSPSNALVASGTEALFFAIYFSALVSLKPEICLQHLGEERAVLYHRYRLAVETALSRADYLNSPQLEPLQAFTLYVACLRTDESGRTSWALLSLVLRLAHALNLHRDGSGLSFPPYEAELRRRLWWQIIVLDVRAVEDRGTDPLIMPDSYTTQLLTNIDDDAFGPESTAPLVPAVGPTDVTFCLCTAMSSGIFLYVCDPSGRFSAGARAGPLSFPQSEEDLMKHVQQLESLFLTDVRPDHMPSMIAATTLRIIVLKLWLSVQYPLQVRASPVPGHARISHEDMLRTAVAVMELCEGLADHGLASQRFGWWSCTYVQWHPLAVALAELCTQTQGELPERAWRVVDKVLPQWSERIADTKRGTLWRPIRKLVRKAKAARVESALKGLGLGPDVNYRVMKEGERGMVRDPFPGAARAKTNEQETPKEESQPSYEDDRAFMGSMGGIGSPSQFLFQQPMDWTLGLGFTDTTDVEGGLVGLDWSAWNEFVTETNWQEQDRQDSTGWD